MIQKIYILFVLLIVCAADLSANPFLTPDSADSNQNQQKKISITPVFNAQFRKIVELQRVLYEKLSAVIHVIKEGNAPFAYPLLALIVFLYGILHALGPGHGKIFIISYFLSRRAPLLKGFLFSFTTAFLHAAFSTVIVLALYTVIEKGLMLTIENTQNIMMKVSYGLITCVGIYLLLSAVLNKDHHTHEKEEFDGRHFFSMAFSIAMTPCPATILILLFSLTNGLLYPGLFAVVFLAVGMGLSLGIVALLTISTSNSTVTIFQKFSGKGVLLSRIFSIAGPVCIIIAGGVLFTYQLLI